MSFVKLDCGILDSTLWVARDPREIFITALLMAEPREFTEPMPQLRATDSGIEETGFVVPPGWYGFIPASGPGIVRKAMADLEAGMSALASLGEPDPESRSRDFDGRRLIRVDGGYIVLNYIKYRERDYGSAERSRRYRERKKNVTDERRDATNERRDITQAEEEAEEERSKESTLRVDVGTERADVPFREIVELFHAKLPTLPACEKLTKARKGYIRQRWLEDLPSLDAWANYFDDVASSKFLTGRAAGRDDRPPFRATLEWLTRPANFAKVLEGTYHRG